MPSQSPHIREKGTTHALCGVMFMDDEEYYTGDYRYKQQVKEVEDK